MMKMFVGWGIIIVETICNIVSTYKKLFCRFELFNESGIVFEE